MGLAPSEDLDLLGLEESAREVRLRVLDMIQRANSSHVGSNFSIVELLTVLYGGVLRFDPAEPDAPGRDRFILSKGHACAALYAVLAQRGFFPTEWLDGFYTNASPLAGHATHKGVPGVEVSTGSLGHGLPIATGMALAAKLDGADHRVFCMLSDGECDEGSNWEPALFAPQHDLDNLVVIIDFNKIQSLGSVEEVMRLEPFAAKWEAFGWHAVEVDGHDIAGLIDVFAAVPAVPGRPTCVIAHTIKGKGVSFMEGELLWHYRSPQGDEYDAARAELAGVPA